MDPDPGAAAAKPARPDGADDLDALVAGNDRVLVEFYIRSVPTLLLFRDGEAVSRLDGGFYGVEAVLEFIESG